MSSDSQLNFNFSFLWTKNLMFPKKLESLEQKVDSTGLSETEKTALIVAWSVIKQNINEHAKNIFVL